MSGPNQKIAIAGVGYSKLARDSGQSIGHLAVTAAREAIRDAGLTADAIDGIGAVFSTDLAGVWPAYVMDGLDLKNIVWMGTSTPPSANIILDGVHAVASGACTYAVCFHAKYRWDVTARDARADALRRSPPMTFDPTFGKTLTEPCAAPNGAAALMRRHMHLYGSKRRHFGMIAVNNRTNAQLNPRAVFCGQPLSMDAYMAAKPIAEPFTILDMDVPIDGAMAVIVTTAERAADLKQPAVIVDACSHMALPQSDMGFQPFDTPAAQRRLLEKLWSNSGCGPKDIDVANVYDGFTILTMTWLEAAFARPGEGPGLLEDAWDAKSGTLRLLGRIPMSTHGGNLSEGRVQGIGHVLEAVTQLRGHAGPRQVPDAKRALVLNGTNPVMCGMILSTPD
ncbi:thiolase family protein [Phenylobacterium sp. VNQ135]|uniref:thiolase family protein n=1 Tax=Phenylobacterium sp. VNQ135 TaxID=3400922 RepID=UPI003BFFEBB5